MVGLFTRAFLLVSRRAVRSSERTATVAEILDFDSQRRVVGAMCSPRFAVTIVWLLLQTTAIGQDSQQPRTVRVASISFEPVKFDLTGNVKRLELWFRKAATGGAKLAVAPRAPWKAT